MHSNSYLAELYSRSDMKQFFDQCCRKKAFKHPNVVRLIGMCLDSPDGFPRMILPLFPDGNLKIDLQKSTRGSPMMTALPQVSFLQGFCLRCMAHLVGKDWSRNVYSKRSNVFYLNLFEGMSTNTLIAMCQDIAQGMSYEKGFIHRYLAAKNCVQANSFELWQQAGVLNYSMLPAPHMLSGFSLLFYKIMLHIIFIIMNFMFLFHFP